MQTLKLSHRQIQENIARSIVDYRFFIYEVFAKSFENFIGGRYIDYLAWLYQNNPWLFRVGARDHFKSTGLYAKFMHALLVDAYTGSENQYFSYSESMSKYHINKIKNLVKLNPYYEGLRDLKPTAESIIAYKWDDAPPDAPPITLEPHGLLTFKRGIHCKRIFIDDPLRDPENKLNPLVIQKVNRVFFTELLDMVIKGGEAHGVGTPQTWQDFFFNPKIKKKFKVVILPAIIDESDKKTLWPEWMDFEELEQRRDLRGVKIFNQEFQCKPVYSENSYFEEQQVFRIINSDLINHPLQEPEPELKKLLEVCDVYGGLDIGKKAHPSHLAVWIKLAPNKWRQLHQKFMDGWDYSKQLEYCNDVIKYFRINRLQYDNTRGEFESFKEQGLLPYEMEPVIFSQKTKNGMAANLQKLVNKTKINDKGEVEDRALEMIDDLRQINQILAVDNDLQAIATPDGHGDSFWSNALALEDTAQTRTFENKPDGF